MVDYFNKLNLRPDIVAAFVGILIATFIAERVSRYLFRKLIKSSTTFISDDPTNYKYFAHALTACIYILGLSLAIREVPPLRAFATSMLAGAGILAVALGFAAQHSLNNIISGLLIVIFKPFRVDDRLRIQDKYYGIVEDISLRHTILRDFENRRIIIPNSVMSNEIIVNLDYNDNNICKYLEFNIDFNADLELAKKVMSDCIAAHPDYIDVRTEEDIEKGKPYVDVRFITIGAYYMTIRGNIWAENNGIAFEMYCTLLETVKKEFDKNGIILPYPKYDVISNLSV
jgi:small conductance mechanosensitive channel